MDYLETVEDSLRLRRVERGITPPKEAGMGGDYTAPTVYRIERHGNYNVSNLFALLADCGLELTFNGSRVGDQRALGVAIRERRSELGLSQMAVTFKTGLTSSRIIAVEHGRNYWKKTLNAYLEILGATISVIDKENG